LSVYWGESHTVHVKKIATFTLLLFYLNASAQTLLPFLVDCIAHILFWQEHMEHVHHGHENHDHVGEEIAHLLSDDTQNDQVPAHPAVIPKPAISEHFHLLPDFSILKKNGLGTAIFSLFISQLLTGYRCDLKQPPEQTSFLPFHGNASHQKHIFKGIRLTPPQVLRMIMLFQSI